MKTDITESTVLRRQMYAKLEIYEHMMKVINIRLFGMPTNPEQKGLIPKKIDETMSPQQVEFIEVAKQLAVLTNELLREFNNYLARGDLK